MPRSDQLQYPVITAHEAPKERWMTQDPNMLTTSTNRNLLQPTKAYTARREDQIKESLQKGKHRSSSASKSKSRERKSGIGSLLTRQSTSSSSKSDRSQLVDLVVEDTEAEEAERVRARKEGGSAWNVEEPKHYVYVCSLQIWPLPD
jgi:hypothetical protein